MSRSPRSLARVVGAACGLWAILGASPSAAVTVDGPCPSHKLRAAGAAVIRIADCPKATAPSNHEFDPACVAAALAVLEKRFAAAEKTEGCDRTIKIEHARRFVERLAAKLVRANANYTAFWRAMIPALAREWQDPDPVALGGTLWTYISGGEGPRFYDPMLRLRSEVLPRCGDGFRNPGEECDGADAPTCVGACNRDCTCGPRCGDGIVNQPGEECDGLDDSSCPGACSALCQCPDSKCGNGVVDPGEECDGSEDGYCGKPGEALACQVCVPYGQDFVGGIHPICCNGMGCVVEQAEVCICKPYCAPPGDRYLGGSCCEGAPVGGYCP